MAITIRTAAGDMAGFDEPVLGQLRTMVAGEVLGPDDRGYDDARRLFNASIDRWPALIARPRGVSDVMEIVRFARSHDRRVWRGVRCILSSEAGGQALYGRW